MFFKTKSIIVEDGLVGSYGISTLTGYLIPNPKLFERNEHSGIW